MENKNNDLTQLLSKVETKGINPLVQGAIVTVNAVSISEEGNNGVDFTHYLEVEKELRKLNYKIEENPALSSLYEELMTIVALFAKREYIREVNFNAKFREEENTFYQVDSTSEKEFYVVMKKIITLQALLGNKVNLKFKAIVDEIFEDFMDILDEAIVNGTETLKDPVKFYKKEVSKCI